MTNYIKTYHLNSVDKLNSGSHENIRWELETHMNTHTGKITHSNLDVTAVHTDPIPSYVMTLKEGNTILFSMPTFAYTYTETLNVKPPVNARAMTYTIFLPYSYVKNNDILISDLNLYVQNNTWDPRNYVTHSGELTYNVKCYNQEGLVKTIDVENNSLIKFKNNMDDFNVESDYIIITATYSHMNNGVISTSETSINNENSTIAYLWKCEGKNNLYSYSWSNKNPRVNGNILNCPTGFVDDNNNEVNPQLRMPTLISNSHVVVTSELAINLEQTVTPVYKDYVTSCTYFVRGDINMRPLNLDPIDEISPLHIHNDKIFMDPDVSQGINSDSILGYNFIDNHKIRISNSTGDDDLKRIMNFMSKPSLRNNSYIVDMISYCNVFENNSDEIKNNISHASVAVLNKRYDPIMFPVYPAKFYDKSIIGTYTTTQVNVPWNVLDGTFNLYYGIYDIHGNVMGTQNIPQGSAVEPSSTMWQIFGNKHIFKAFTSIIIGTSDTREIFYPGYNTNNFGYMYFTDPIEYKLSSLIYDWYGPSTTIGAIAQGPLWDIEHPTPSGPTQDAGCLTTNAGGISNFNCYYKWKEQDTNLVECSNYSAHYDYEWYKKPNENTYPYYAPAVGGGTGETYSYVGKSKIVSLRFNDKHYSHSLSESFSYIIDKCHDHLIIDVGNDCLMRSGLYLYDSIEQISLIVNGSVIPESGKYILQGKDSNGVLLNKFYCYHRWNIKKSTLNAILSQTNGKAGGVNKIYLNVTLVNAPYKIGYFLNTETHDLHLYGSEYTEKSTRYMQVLPLY